MNTKRMRTTYAETAHSICIYITLHRLKYILPVSSRLDIIDGIELLQTLKIETPIGCRRAMKNTCCILGSLWGKQYPSHLHRAAINPMLSIIRFEIG